MAVPSYLWPAAYKYHLFSIHPLNALVLVARILPIGLNKKRRYDGTWLRPNTEGDTRFLFLWRILNPSLPGKRHCFWPWQWSTHPNQFKAHRTGSMTPSFSSLLLSISRALPCANASQSEGSSPPPPNNILSQLKSSQSLNTRASQCLPILATSTSLNPVALTLCFSCFPGKRQTAKAR